MIRLLNRKILIGVIFAGICLLGVVSFRFLPLELYPNTELPMLLVRIASRIDVDPSYMETSGVIPMEGAAAMLEGVDNLLSYAEPRRGTIYVYFDKDVDLKYAYLKLQQRVAAIKAQLPDAFTVEVDKVNTEQAANQFMTLQVLGDGGADRIRNIVDQQIAPDLQDVDGVASAQVFGGRSKTVEIVMNDDICRAYNITPARIQNLLKQNNNARQYVGALRDGGKRFFVDVDAEFRTIDDLKNISVSNKNGKVLLKNIADVFYGFKEPTSLSRVNGKEAVSVQLVRDAQVNLIDLSHQTQAAIRKLNTKLAPQNVRIVIQANAADAIEDGLRQIAILVLIGGLLAVGVLWIFLRNLRLVLIVAAAIPISVLGAFNLFYVFGITLNSLTLVGMALAVGMLVDNSVVVMENIYRLASRGRDPVTAVTRGTAEVWRSVFASTLTTVVIFVPFLFAADFTVRLIGKHVGVSVIATLVISLVTAFLLVPMAILLRLRNAAGATFSFRRIDSRTPAIRIYRVLLKAALRHPGITVCGALAVFLVSLGICLTQGSDSAEQAESEQFSVYLTMPTGATLDKTDFAVRELEKRLQGLDETDNLLSMVYEDEAALTIKLRKNYADIAHRSLPEIKADIQKRVADFPLGSVGFTQPASSARYRGNNGANAAARLQQLLGAGSQDETVVVRGDDFDRMEAVADEIRFELTNLSTIQSVQLDIPGRQGEVHLFFDTQLMREYGIGLQSVASELSGFTQELTSGLEFKQGADQYDIMVTSKGASVQNRNAPGRGAAQNNAKTFDQLNNVPVSASDGTDHPLEEISRIIRANGPASINRANQEHRIVITYHFNDEITSAKALLKAAREEVDNTIDAMTFPPGIAVEPVHGQAGLSDFYWLIGAAFILIYMILASVFESLTAPLVMMFSIPLAAIGAFWLLISTGHSLLDANSLMGFLILFGVVVGNGIILIDFTRVLRRRGFSMARALMAAGQDRMRPIFITAITTAVGMLPLALGKGGEISAIGAPFALTVIGGIISASLLTLVFIPTCYFGLESSLAYIRSLSWPVRIVQIGVLGLCWWLVFVYVDDPLWRLADVIIIAVAIPAMTWFLLSSLRRAGRSGREQGPVTIHIRNVQKIYNMPGRFLREWESAVKGITNDKARGDWGELVWQVPLFAFLVYFAYWYAENEFLQFAVALGVCCYGLFLFRRHARFTKFPSSDHGRAGDVKAMAYEALFWGAPLANMVFFYLAWERLSVVLLAGIAWYFGCAVYRTSRWLHNNPGADPRKWENPWSKPAAAFVAIVKMLPVPGRRRPTFHALKGISLQIEHGMFGLLGPNGAGKSTLMRIVAGIYEQTYGKVYINGLDTALHREELQGLIGYLPQEFGTYPNLTAREFMDYQAIIKGLRDPATRQERILSVLTAVHMEDHADEKIGSFSGGMKQRIGIAQIMLHLPRILVVDEPTAGLDPSERIRFRNLLVELSRQRVVIFSTHIIEDISSSCNRMAVLIEGELRYAGEPAGMLRHAAGRVWQMTVDNKEYDALARRISVVRHISDGDRIHVRCIASERPHPEAQPVQPTLEDSYLCLTRDLKHADERGRDDV
ncbi:MAG TPA: efflux RND transporter permease subunit [Chitinivibrionales bacterium]|jgi:multidrug efflux pump subunit AcrB/ABC-type multidrug transport system ATPase subunit|nr:efflux RND transporter permease subunit [Chitinivibrionales bacterium]